MEMPDPPATSLHLTQRRGWAYSGIKSHPSVLTPFSHCHLPSRGLCAYFLTPLGFCNRHGLGIHALVGFESPDIIRLSKWERRIHKGGGSQQCRPGLRVLSQHSLLMGSQVIPGQGHCRKGSLVRLRTENKCFGSRLTLAF